MAKISLLSAANSMRRTPGRELIETLKAACRIGQNPNRRIAALYYLGECFARRNMFDLAAKTLQTASGEKVGFDDEKKQLIYALGLVYEKMGKAEDAINQFKQIYEVDIEYKDVAQKVDAYYANSGS